MTGPVPALLLGPVLRYTDATTATVWVETTGPAEVTVLDRSTRTFEVAGHHYGYVVLDGLPEGTDTAYDVRLDGQRVWPRDDDRRPAPRLRTARTDGGLDLVFGSCRVDRPHELPWDLQPEQHPDGVGIDALQALARACQRGERPLPDLLLMLGDQVYADEGLSPEVQAKQRRRRPEGSEPQHEVADFEEYTWLYLDSWSNPDVRWLLSTVPSAMVFDDHDVRDDWNTSRAWRHRVQQLPWWRERIVGAYMTYWLYQHLGNVAPAEVERDGLLRAVRAEGEPALRRFAEQADDEVDGRKLSRWSFVRDWGEVRLVVVDTRSGRVVEDDARRRMLSEPEWQQVRQWLRGDCTHLLVGSSLPLLFHRSLHDLERWDEALVAGAWGRRGARFGEWLRQAADLEHWSAFSWSFDRMLERIGEVARGEHGRAPSTVLVLSGDVHHSYVAPVAFPDDPVPPSTSVVQVVSSPMRNAFPRRLQRAFRFAASRPARLLGRGLARAAGLPRPSLEWGLEHGPFFGNMLGRVRLEGRRADLTLTHGVLRDGGPAFEVVHESTLSGRLGPVPR